MDLRRFLEILESILFHEAEAIRLEALLFF